MQRTSIIFLLKNHLKSKRNWRRMVPDLVFDKKNFPEIGNWSKKQGLKEEEVFLYVNSFMKTNHDLIVDFFRPKNILLHIWRMASSYFGFEDSIWKNIRQIWGFSANKHLLNSAEIRGSRDKIQMLIKCGANPNCSDILKRTPLMLAARSSDLEAVRALIESGANINASDSLGSSPIHYPLKFSSENPDDTYLVIKELIRAGANINRIGFCLMHSGELITPLQMTEQYRNPSYAQSYAKIAAFLIFAGAKTDGISENFLKTAQQYSQEIEQEVERDILELTQNEINELNEISGESNIKVKILKNGLESEIKLTQNPMDITDNFISRFEKLTPFARFAYLKKYVKKSPSIIDYAILSMDRDRIKAGFQVEDPLKKIIALLKSNGISMKEILTANAHERGYTPAWIEVFIHSGFGAHFDFRPTIESLLENGANPAIVKRDILECLKKYDSAYSPVGHFLHNTTARKALDDFLEKISPDEPKEEKESIENEMIQSLNKDKGLDSDESEDHKPNVLRPR